MSILRTNVAWVCLAAIALAGCSSDDEPADSADSPDAQAPAGSLTTTASGPTNPPATAFPPVKATTVDDPAACAYLPQQVVQEITGSEGALSETSMKQQVGYSHPEHGETIQACQYELLTTPGVISYVIKKVPGGAVEEVAKLAEDPDRRKAIDDGVTKEFEASFGESGVGTLIGPGPESVARVDFAKDGYVVVTSATNSDADAAKTWALDLAERISR